MPLPDAKKPARGLPPPAGKNLNADTETPDIGGGFSACKYNRANQLGKTTPQVSSYRSVAQDVEARPIGCSAAEFVADLAFCRNCQRLHDLGPRVVTEAFAELGARYGIQNGIDELVQRYADLEDDMLRAVGGDRMPAIPCHEVSGRAA